MAATKTGGAVGLGHASSGHATGHADISMEMFLSTQSSKCKTICVTWCQIEFPSTLQKKVFSKSKLSLLKNFIEHF